jgi:hypothetical protein
MINKYRRAKIPHKTQTDFPGLNRNALPPVRNEECYRMAD